MVANSLGTTSGAAETISWALARDWLGMGGYGGEGWAWLGLSWYGEIGDMAEMGWN